MNKVLLTGATGFIGRHCTSSLLEKGYAVHVVSSKVLEENRPGVHWHRCDLLDSKQVPELVANVQPAYLLHLAWCTIPGKYWTSLENFHWVQASLGLLNEFVKQGGRRAVMAGTCAEYDWNYGYCSERVTPLLPGTVYGTCKHSLQMMLDAFAEQTELSSAWGRIFFLYGPREYPARLVSSVIRSILQGVPARCSHGNQIRDFLHVQDAADAFVSLLQSEVQGPVNIASGMPIPLKVIINRIGDMLGRPDLIRLGEIPAPPSEPPLLVADVRRLTDEVGWKPHFDLDTGLAQTIEWWRAQEK
jgi:nucleoside-diphosphate-sugar epimerase